MQNETAVEKLINEISKDRVGQAIIKTFFKEFEDAKKLEREQKLDFANWCRIQDNKFPNRIMTIQQLYDEYEKSSEIESVNSSERKNTLSDYGLAGEDSSMEYKQTEHPKVFSEDGQELFFDEQGKILNQIADTHPLVPQMKPFVQEEQPQPNTPELENNPEPSTPKVRIQTALDIFELEEWRLEAFGIRTPTEFEEYREQRKQLYDKCRNIERMEQEKLIREACTICTKALMAGDNTTVEEVVNQVLNRSNN